MSITGPVDGAPTKHGVAIVDLATGMLATIAILGALNARAASGRGRTVSVSLFESGLALLANVASNHLVSGKPARRYGKGHPNIVPYGTFRAADGDLASRPPLPTPRPRRGRWCWRSRIGRRKACARSVFH
jgi:crotonobetainyl-CoA:carnitine CoA-transferase CaiB-like acyl-CoA transferase